MYPGLSTNESLVLIDAGDNGAGTANDPKTYKAIELSMKNGGIGTLSEGPEDQFTTRAVNNGGRFHKLVRGEDSEPELDKEFSLFLDNNNIEDRYGYFDNKDMVGLNGKTIITEMTQDLEVVIDQGFVDQQVGVADGVDVVFNSIMGVEAGYDFTIAFDAGLKTGLDVKIAGVAATYNASPTLATDYSVAILADGRLAVTFGAASPSEVITMSYHGSKIVINSMNKTMVPTYNKRKIYMFNGAVAGGCEADYRFHFLYITAENSYNLDNLAANHTIPQEFDDTTAWDGDLSATDKPIIQLRYMCRVSTPMINAPDAGADVSADFNMVMGSSPNIMGKIEEIPQKLANLPASTDKFIRLLFLLRDVSVIECA